MLSCLTGHSEAGVDCCLCAGHSGGGVTPAWIWKALEYDEYADPIAIETKHVTFNYMTSLIIARVS